jgi:hypothetical protein
MGLSIGVGSLAQNIFLGDLEGVDVFREAFARINLVLAEKGLPPHHEPESLPRVPRSRAFPEQLGYSYYNFLARAIAYARQAPKEFTPVGDNDPKEDRRLEHEFTVYMDSHIICHSDVEGFYVPVDFHNPIYDDRIWGEWLGSSQRALAELVLAAPLLGIPLRKGKLSDKAARLIAEEDDGAHPCWRERRVWLKFFEAACHSIAFGTAISFG